MLKTAGLITLSLCLAGSAFAQGTSKKDTSNANGANDVPSTVTQSQSDGNQKRSVDPPSKPKQKSTTMKRSDSPHVIWGQNTNVDSKYYTSLFQMLDNRYGNQIVLDPTTYSTLITNLADGYNSLTVPNVIVPGNITYNLYPLTNVAVPQDSNSNTIYTVPNVDFFQGLADWTILTPGKDKKVDLDLDDVPLKEALQTLLGQEKIPFDMDKDVPAGTMITLKAKGIRFYTALNVITEMAGVGWRSELRQEGSNKAELKPHIQITKDRKRGMNPFNRWMLSSPNVLNFNRTLRSLDNQDLNRWNLEVSPLDLNKWKDLYTDPNNLDSKALKELPTNPKPLWELQTPNGTITVPAPKSQGRSTPNSPLPLLQTPDGTTLGNLGGNRSLLYDLSKTEERSTFTCPHCHEQITVIRKHVTLKCPTCGRTFQSDWKFCPFDGAKRPAEPEDWKYCPHCGKPIP